MQTLMRPKSPTPPVKNRELLRSSKKRRFSPFVFTGAIMTLLLVLGVGAFEMLQPKGNSRAAEE